MRVLWLCADVAARLAPDYCHFVNTLGTGAGAPDGRVGRDPPDQARLAQLAEEQAALRRVAALVAQATPPAQVFAAVAEEVGRLLAVDFAILVRYDTQDTLEVVGTWTRTGAPAPTPVGGRQVILFRHCRFTEHPAPLVTWTRWR